MLLLSMDYPASLRPFFIGDLHAMPARTTETSITREPVRPVSQVLGKNTRRDYFPKTRTANARTSMTPAALLR
jgi:hypothetical protein